MYCRWTWDLRNSGGRWEGGCVGGYFMGGGPAKVVVVAAATAVERGLKCGGGKN